MVNIQKMLSELKKARDNGQLTNDELKQLSQMGDLNLDTEIQNVHNESINKTGQNYENNAYRTAAAKKKVDFDAADKLTNIEEKATEIKEARSDDTRKELEGHIDKYNDKQDQRYKDVQEIVDTQKRIANRQANIEAAKSGRYGDVYSDASVSNIKNDIINRYGDNISAAQQYALQNNRAIDGDVLNTGYQSVNDRDKRDAFKDALLDKNNSYIMDAIRSAAAGDKKALEDVESFYQSYARKKADDEYVRAENTERREAFEKEWNSLNTEGKAQMLRDQLFNVEGYNLVADRIPDLIAKYPTLSLSELKAKGTKIAELALSGKQFAQTIAQKDDRSLTESERRIYSQYTNRGYDELTRSDRTYEATLAQNENDRQDSDGVNNTFNTNKNNIVYNGTNSTVVPNGKREVTTKPQYSTTQSNGSNIQNTSQYSNSSSIGQNKDRKISEFTQEERTRMATNFANFINKGVEIPGHMIETAARRVADTYKLSYSESLNYVNSINAKIRKGEKVIL